MGMIYATLFHSYPLLPVTIIYDPEQKVYGARRGECFTVCAMPSTSDVKAIELSEFVIESVPFKVEIPKGMLKEVRSIDNILMGAEKGAILDNVPTDKRSPLQGCDLIVNTEHIVSDKESYEFSVIVANLRKNK